MKQADGGKIVMKTKTQHTPTPWKIERDDDGIQRIVAQRYIAKIERWHKYGCGSQYQEIEDNLKAESEANANLIVRAVNSHEALLNVARWLINEREAGTDKGLLPDGLLNATRKAIAQVEGGK